MQHSYFGRFNMASTRTLTMRAGVFFAVLVIVAVDHRATAAFAVASEQNDLQQYNDQGPPPQQQKPNYSLLSANAVSRSDDEDNLLYLEERCGQMTEITVMRPVTIRLRHPSVNLTATNPEEVRHGCSVHVALRTQRRNFSLLVSMHRFNLADREGSGVCIQQFLQISLGEKKQPVRVCHQLESLRMDELMMSSSNDLYFYYFRKSPLLPEQEIDITVAPVTFMDQAAGGCPVEEFPPAVLSGGSDQHTPPEELPRMFECHSDGLCLPPALRCDSVHNCLDHSDELACPTAADDGTNNNHHNESSTTPSEDTQEKVDANAAADGQGIDDDSKTPHIIIGVTGGVIIIALVALIVLIVLRKQHSRRDGGAGGGGSTSSNAPEGHSFQPVTTVEPASRNPVRPYSDRERDIDTRPARPDATDSDV